jgi:hypothetical protein
MTMMMIIQFSSSQFNSCLFTCKLNSTGANYKVSTSTQKYTKQLKEQNTKYDSLYKGNKINNNSKKNWS